MNRISHGIIALTMTALQFGMAQAQAPTPDATAPVIEMTLPALRAQLDSIPTEMDDTDKGDDVQLLVAQTNRVFAQAQKFVASRTGQLADLNARLGELGSAPAAGTTEDPDVNGGAHHSGDGVGKVGRRTTPA